MLNEFILSPFFLDRPLSGLETIASKGWRLNKPTLPPGKSQDRMAHLYQPLADFVSHTLRSGARPVSIAGDCCASLGVLAGLQRAGIQPSLVWLDAHGDFNTWETTPSGFLGGMPLAMGVGRGEQTILKSLELMPFPETRVILTDARDLDPGERNVLVRSDVTLLKDVSDLLSQPLSGAVYLHFDTDILDPSYAPAMNYRADGGPSVNTMQHIFRHLAGNADVIAVSLSSWNPELDEDGRTGKTCMDLLNTLLYDG